MKNARAELELLTTPENIAAWERVLPTLSPADREQLGSLVAQMKQRAR